MTLKQTLQDAFELAALRDEARAISRVGPHAATRLWAEVRETIDKAARLREEELRRHRDNYDTRVENYKKYVRDQDKPPHRAYEPYPFRGAKFDEASVTRQSRLMVEHGHQARMARINRGEDKRLQNIRKEARALYLAHGKLVAAFTRAADPDDRTYALHRGMRQKRSR